MGTNSRDRFDAFHLCAMIGIKNGLSMGDVLLEIHEKLHPVRVAMASAKNAPVMLLEIILDNFQAENTRDPQTKLMRQLTRELEQEEALDEILSRHGLTYAIGTGVEIDDGITPAEAVAGLEIQKALDAVCVLNRYRDSLISEGKAGSERSEALDIILSLARKTLFQIDARDWHVK